MKNIIPLLVVIVVFGGVWWQSKLNREDREGLMVLVVIALIFASC